MKAWTWGGLAGRRLAGSGLALVVMVLSGVCLLGTAGHVHAQPGANKAPAKESSPAARRQYSTAVGLQNTEQFKLAAGEWLRFLKSFPDDPLAGKATYYLALCQLNAQEADGAMATFKTVLAKYPDLDKEMLETSHLYLGYAQYSQAVKGKPELFKDAAATFAAQLKAYPMGGQAAEAHYLRGECLYNLGQRDEAAKEYAAIVEKFPMAKRLPDAMYALGVSLAEQKKFAEAGKIYTDFLAKFAEHPFSTEVRMRLGESEFQAGNFDAAAKLFAAAAGVEGFSFADHAAMRLADTLAQQKKFAEAAAQYAAVGAKFPSSSRVPLANLLGGKSYYLAGDYAKANELLNNVLKAGGADAPEAAHWIARGLIKSGGVEQALAVVTQILPNTPADNEYLPSLLMDQADALYEQPAKRADSVAVYKSVVAKYPQHAVAPQAAYMAAFTQSQLEQYEAALADADAFLKAYPDSEFQADVMNIAAEANLHLGKYAAAETQFQQLVAKYGGKRPEAEAWKVRWALALYLQDKFQQVVDGLKPLVPALKTPAMLAEVQFLVGSSHLQLKQYAEAAASLAAAIKADPKWRQADETLISLAYAQNLTDDTKGAIDSVRRLIAEFPESKLQDRAQYRLGQYLDATGDELGAEQAYAVVVTKYPDSKLLPAALYYLAWAQYSQEKHDAAIESATKLLTAFPKDKLAPATAYLRALCLQQKKEFEKAVPDLQAFLASKPAQAEASNARYALALCQAGLKKFDDVLATAETLLKEDPEYAQADKVLYEVGWALKSLDKPGEAAAKFGELAAKRPESPLAPEALFHVAEKQYQDEEFTKAAETYGKAVAKAGKSIVGENALHKLGWTQYRLEEFAKAAETFAKQQAEFPEGGSTADAAFMEAECLFKQEKFPEALAKYEALPQLENKDYAVLAALHAAQSANSEKKYAQAEKLAADGLKNFPNNDFKPEFLFEQATALQHQNKEAEAEALYEQVTELTGREVAARARFMVGELYFARKQHDRALVQFIRVKSSYAYETWQANATYEAGLCLEALKKPSKAVEFYQEIVDKWPDSPRAADAKARLKNSGG